MGSLIVSNGDAVSVQTERIMAEAIRLGAVAHLLDGWTTRATGILVRSGSDPCGGDGPARPEARAVVERLRDRLARAGLSASLAADGLVRAAGEYERAEQLADLGRRLAAAMVGASAPSALVPAASAAAIALGPAALATLIAAPFLGPGGVEEALGRLVSERGLPVLSDPAFVDLVRAAADGADEFLAGLLGSLPLLAVGSGIDAPENAAMLLAAAGLVGALTGGRALRETEVAVVRVDRPAGHDGRPGDVTAPPRGIGDLADRIPPARRDGPQVRIERYAGPDGDRWIVYSSGTADFGLEPGEEPYDMTSNLHSVADASSIRLRLDAAAAERSVRLAMAEAGVEPGDPVIVVGHSAGGIVAAELAADPSLEVVAAVNLGGPGAQVDTGDTPFLSVAHAEDLVPATGGSGLAVPQRIDVVRGLGEVPPVDGNPVPAHALRRYRGTAELIDASDDPRLVEFRGVLDGLVGGGAAEVTEWRAARTQAGPSAPDPDRAPPR